MKRHWFVIVLVAGLAACATHGHNHGVISGSADLAAFFELPPDAAFVAVLEDVSKADVVAQEVGRARLQPTGQPPFHFEIDYDRNLIDASHRYVVRARVLSGERVLLVSDAAYPVLTQGAGDKVHILLKPT